VMTAGRDGLGAGGRGVDGWAWVGAAFSKPDFCAAGACGVLSFL
jgi:hypothetical protein